MRLAAFLQEGSFLLSKAFLLPAWSHEVDAACLAESFNDGNLHIGPGLGLRQFSDRRFGETGFLGKVAMRCWFLAMVLRRHQATHARRQFIDLGKDHVKI